MDESFTIRSTICIYKIDRVNFYPMATLKLLCKTNRLEAYIKDSLFRLLAVSHLLFYFNPNHLRSVSFIGISLLQFDDRLPNLNITG